MALARPVTFWLLLTLLFLFLLWSLKAILLPFVLGFVIAYFLHPYADRLEKKGWRRFWATAVVLVSFFVVWVGFLFLFLPILLEQGIRFLGAIPDYIHTGVDYFAPLIEKLTRWVDPEMSSQFSFGAVAQKGVGVAIGFLTRLWSGGMAVLNFFGLIAITPIVAFYLLGKWPAIVGFVDDLIPRKRVKTIRKLATEIDTILVSFVNGTVVICTLLALFYGGALSLLNLKYGFTIGVSAGALSFIPYVGPLYGIVVSLGIALFQFWPHWFPLAVVFIIFILGQLLSDYLLVPKILGNKMQLHPLWIIFGVFAGGALLGFVGMLIAVPLTAVIGVLARFSINEYKQSKLYRQEKL